jgi:hypothetical protein
VNEPFEHEARIKELLVRQAQLNAALDLDKNKKQVAPPAEDDSGVAGDVILESTPQKSRHGSDFSPTVPALSLNATKLS